MPFLRVPRLGEVPPDPVLGRSKGSPSQVIRRVRLTALAGGLLAGWLAVPLLVDVPRPQVLGPLGAALAVAAAAFTVAEVIRLRRGEDVRPSYLARVAAGFGVPGAWFLAAAIAVAVPMGAGTVLRVAPHRFLVGQLGTVVPAVALTVVLLVAVIFASGVVVQAYSLTLDAGGGGPRRVPFRWALLARSSRDLLTPRSRRRWSRTGLGVGASFLRGLITPGLLAADWTREIADRVLARVTDLRRDVVHVEIPDRDLVRGLSTFRWATEVRGRFVYVSVPREADTEVQVIQGDAPLTRALKTIRKGLRPGGDSHPITIRRSHLLCPAAAHGHLLVVFGRPDGVRRVRAALERELLMDGVFAWSREAVRVERRLNALHSEADRAVTVKERTSLLEESERLGLVVAARPFVEEERALLLAWKTGRVASRLRDRLLIDPDNVEPHGRTLAPGCVLPPDLGLLVDAGGLAAVKRLVFVPYWVVPVSTRLGDLEVTLSAVTRHLDPHESRDVLDALENVGPRHFIDTTKTGEFLPRIPATGALYGEVKRVLRQDLEYEGAAVFHEAYLDVVYVPFAETAAGYVNAITGVQAPHLEKAMPKAKVPEGTLVN